MNDNINPYKTREQARVNTKYSNNKELIEKLKDLSDEKYRKFQSSLLPETKNIIGVRLPELRKIAKTAAKENPQKFIKNLGNSFEENMLHGMVIGYIKADTSEILNLITHFLPKIDNWSVCDSFCSGLKFTRENKTAVWNYIEPLFAHKDEFYVRFAIVMCIFYFIDTEYIKKIFHSIAKVNHNGYYAKMAEAWLISMCYVNFPKDTIDFLQSHIKDEFVFKKSIQKICESKQVTKNEKILLRKLLYKKFAK